MPRSRRKRRRRRTKSENVGKERWCYHQLKHKCVESTHVQYSRQSQAAGGKDTISENEEGCKN